MNEAKSDPAGGKQGKSGPASDPPVASIMQTAMVTTTPTELLSAARESMQSRDVRQLPVLENGLLVGILSDRDLHAHSGYLERTKVDAAMTWDPITVPPGATVTEAATLLLEKKLNAVPVVDGGKLVGIVSRSDLLRLLLDVLRRG